MVLTTATTLSAQHLRNQIQYNLDTENPRTASFLAGRLHALEPRNPDSSHLLALTALRLQRYGAAYDAALKYAHNGRHLGCAYVFAQSCLELERFTEGISALEKAKAQWHGKNSWGMYAEGKRKTFPDAPAVWNTLGRLWQRHGDLRKAGDCFVEAHKSNFFLWESFEGLCNIGADLNVEKMFKPTAEMLNATALSDGSLRPAADSAYAAHTAANGGRVDAEIGFSTIPSNDPFSTQHTIPEAASFVLPKVKGKTALANGTKGKSLDWETPTTNGRVYDNDVEMGGNLPQEEEHTVETITAPVRKPRTGANVESGERIRQPALRNHVQATSESGNDFEAHPVQRKPSVGGQKRTLSGHPTQAANLLNHHDAATQPTRRSNRLYTQSTTTTRSTRQVNGTGSGLATEDRAARPARAATGTRGRVGAQVGRVVSGNTRKIAQPDPSEKDKIRRAPSRNTERAVDAPSVASVMVEQRSSRPNQIRAQADEEHEHQKQQLYQQRQSMDDLCHGLGKLATGVYALSRYDLSTSLQTFKSLPSAQRETPYVLAQMGKAYYEAANYHESEAFFAKLLRLQPSRIEDMEVYSTVLWQLKKDSALALLCHTLKEHHFDAPQTWVAVGNAFSLSREHDQAIAAFKRATQVAGAGHFGYAWTLMGHELIANEEFDAALSAFRKSVSVERRGFGGWYGLGECYKRMGKYEEAERHYRIAAALNPSNSVLLVCIGVVLERLQKRESALAHYCRALDMAPQSALARFKRSRILLHMRLYQDALEDLEELRGQAPDEANVWFLLGKCFKGLGQRGDALKAFTTALNLDVKAAPFIKEAIETLDLDDDDESDDE